MKKTAFINEFEYELKCDDHVRLAVERGLGGRPVTDHFHFHKRIEIMYVSEGSITMRTEYDENLTANAGEMLVIEEGMLHHVSASDCSDTTMIQLPEDNMERYLKAKGNHSLGSNVVKDSENRLFEKLCHELDNYKYTEGAEEYVQNMIDTLLSGIILKCGLVPKRKSAAPLLKNIMSYILKNLGNTFTIQDIAKAMGYSPRSISDIFCKHVGMKLKDYILIKRLENAKRMLDERFTIAEACEKSGFGSLQNFHRAFRMYEDITPGEYQSNSTFTPGRNNSKYEVIKERYTVN